MSLCETINTHKQHLTALRWPRSSGGSLRSLTASITADRRSVIFFSRFDDEEFEEVVAVDDEDEEDEEEEAHLSLDPSWLTNGDEMSAVELVIKDDDNRSILASRVAIG